MKEMTSKEIGGGFFVGAKELTEELIETGKRIAKAEASKVIEINGNTYLQIGNELRIVRPVVDDDPFPATLTVFTLDGMVEYIRSNAEQLIPEEEKLVLHVKDEYNVVLLSQPTKHQKLRKTLLFCYAHAPSIEFSRYMDVETFNTMLLTKFIATESRDMLFAVVKSLTKEQSGESRLRETGRKAGGRFSKCCNVKQGVSMASNVIFKNPIPLKPMRTFSEIDQPESNFTMRVNENAQVALFESDGGAWRNEAVRRIGNYLKENLEGCNVVVIA